MFGFSFHKKSADEVELFLKKYKLFSLEYRLFTRLGHYLDKVLVSELSPPGLKSLLAEKSCSRTYNLRATDRFIVPKMNDHFGDATFIFVDTTRIYKYPLFVNTERKFVNVQSKLQISKIIFF